VSGGQDDGGRVDCTVTGRVAVIRLDRPGKLNALSTALVRGMAEAFTLAQDDVGIAVIVLTGTGRAFCAGMDIHERVASGAAGLGHPDISPLVDPFFPYRSAELTKPVIAAVNGLALGAGCYLVGNADLVVAADTATFEVTEVRHGVAIGWDFGLLAGLPRSIAMELALGGRLTAARAHQVGLVNEVVTTDALLPTALAMAERIATLPQAAVRANRALVDRLAPHVPAELRREAQRVNDVLQESAETAHSLRSFVQRS
jgi:enoyl-CoA hydratase/carnithine racemase